MTPRWQRGFTFIEMMIVVGIISILSMMALNFSGPIRREYEHRYLARELYQCLSEGRASALRYGRTIKVEIGTTTRTTTWIDNNLDNVVDVTETLLCQYPASPSSYAAGFSVASTFGSSLARFSPEGRSVDSAGDFASGQVTVTDSTYGTLWYIDVTVAGAMRVWKP